MRRLATSAGYFALATVLASQAVFRSRVDTVVLDVFAFDQAGPIRGLSKPDFIVRDNGIVQDVAEVVTDTSGLSIALLLDTSSSLSTQDLALLERAVTAASADLGPRDELTLVTFTERVTVHGQIEPIKVDSVFKSIRSGGDTALRDAAAVGFELLASTSGRRPVVIALSDGTDTASWVDERTLELAARRSWATMVAVAPRGKMDPILPKLTELTGGEILLIDRERAALPEVLKAIIAKLRQRYIVAFTPTSASAGWHSLDVQVRKPGVRATFRKGYTR